MNAQRIQRFLQCEKALVTAGADSPDGMERWRRWTRFLFRSSYWSMEAINPNDCCPPLFPDPDANGEYLTIGEVKTIVVCQQKTVKGRGARVVQIPDKYWEMPDGSRFEIQIDKTTEQDLRRQLASLGGEIIVQARNKLGRTARSRLIDLGDPEIDEDDESDDDYEDDDVPQVQAPQFVQPAPAPDTSSKLFEMLLEQQKQDREDRRAERESAKQQPVNAIDMATQLVGAIAPQRGAQRDGEIETLREALKEERALRRRETDDLAKRAQDAADEARKRHDREVESLRKDIERRDRDLDDARRAHREEIAALTKRAAEEIADVKDDARKRVKDLEDSLDEMRKDHRQEIKERDQDMRELRRLSTMSDDKQRGELMKQQHDLLLLRTERDQLKKDLDRLQREHDKTLKEMDEIEEENQELGEKAMKAGGGEGLEGLLDKYGKHLPTILEFFKSDPEGAKTDLDRLRKEREDAQRQAAGQAGSPPPREVPQRRGEPVVVEPEPMPEPEQNPSRSNAFANATRVSVSPSDIEEEDEPDGDGDDQEEDPSDDDGDDVNSDDDTEVQDDAAE